MRFIALVGVIVGITAGCGPRPLNLPQGAGTPMTDFAPTFERLTATCRGVRTWTAEMALSGRAAGSRVRGRVLAGLAEPGLLRLEGVAPFGPPAFILAAKPGDAVLLLPRDARVVRGADATAILDALAGLPLGPDDLRAILTGCVVPSPVAASGTVYGSGWGAIMLRDDATAYIRPAAGESQLVAARVGSLTVEYPEWAAGVPRRLRLRLPAGAGARAGDTDLSVTLDQVELNVPIAPAAFSVDVPPDATPLTIDELRDAGPLGGGRRTRGTK